MSEFRRSAHVVPNMRPCLGSSHTTGPCIQSALNGVSSKQASSTLRGKSDVAVLDRPGILNFNATRPAVGPAQRIRVSMVIPQRPSRCTPSNEGWV